MKRIFISFCLVLFMVVMVSPCAVNAAQPVKIGFVYIMSGPAATYGQFAKKGAELAIDEINKSGGINGQQVEGLFEDSTGKPDVGLRVMRKLVFQEKVKVLVGLDSSGVAKTVVPSIPQLKVPLIITHAATPDVTGSVCNRNVFRIALNLPQNVKTASLIAKESGAKKWNTIGPDYSFGHQSWEYFQQYLKAEMPDATFVSDDQAVFPPSKTTDFNPYINKLMQSNPDGILVSLWGGNLIDFIRQGKELGLFNGQYKILCTLGAATEVLSALGDKMPEGIWVGTRYWFLANPSERNKKFVDAYWNRYKEYPSYNAHGAYAAVYAYKAAVEKGKSTDTDKVINALEGLTVEVPAGVITIRPEDHQAITDAHWGVTAADPNYSIRILKPMKILKGADITPPVTETGCSMQ